MAQPTSEPLKDSQLLQDFLLDMDFDEFIPVNNFFSGYVQALDVGSHSGASALPRLARASCESARFPHRSLRRNISFSRC